MAIKQLLAASFQLLARLLAISFFCQRAGVQIDLQN
jgi:hypothetical protein